MPTDPGASATPLSASRLSVSVVICTFNRPDTMPRALASARAQILPAGWQGRVVVVDNAPDSNAAAAVTELSAGPGLPVRYVALPCPNIALARNAGVAASASDWVAFLDDDEWCEPGWLAALLTTASASGADVVFGPVAASFPAGPPEWDASGRFYERRFAAPSGTRVGLRPDPRATGRWLATCNTLLRRATCLAGDAPFDPRFGRSGGEDTDLFHRLAQADRKIVWCAEALVHDLVPPDRTGFDYMLYRHRRGARQWMNVVIHQARHPHFTMARLLLRALAQYLVLLPAWLLGFLLPPARRRAPTPLSGRVIQTSGDSASSHHALRLRLAAATGKLTFWRLPKAYL
jgi:succinoglycan biosynthesis protein ExoM